MELNKEQAAYLLKIVETAQSVGLKAFVIDEGIRGVTEDSTATIMHTDNVMEFPFGKMGIPDTSSLAQRYTLFKASKIEVEMDNSDRFAKKLTFTSGKSKVSYRLSDPNGLRAPKAFKDNTVAGVVSKLGEDVVDQLERGSRAMGSSAVRFAAVDGGMTLSIVDVNQEELSISMDEHIEDIDGNPANFNFLYPKQVLMMLKKNPDTPLLFSSRGLLFIEINGFRFAALPTAERKQGA